MHVLCAESVIELVTNSSGLLQDCKAAGGDFRFPVRFNITNQPRPPSSPVDQLLIPARAEYPPAKYT